ncbi:DUF4394 domain-containing protein [bacterium]|nr:DUF4394 domain-containing protein [bacterium]MCI0606275.1 DUF4394 domain-containing protein [bacterium]
MNRSLQVFEVNRISKLKLLILAISFIGGFASYSLAGQTLYAITTNNTLVQFDSSNPCTIASAQSVSGLAEDEALVGIDFRPATGDLYGLGSSNRIYLINTSTGQATAVGTTEFAIPIQGKAVGFDFNPTVDRIRIVTNTGQNLRVHPGTGAIVGFDTNLAYAGTDANAGVHPVVVAAAYTNPDNDPATGTTLYDLDVRLNILAIQNPPNSGTLNTVGSLGADSNVLTGFDIAPSGTAYAALKITGQASTDCGKSTLVTVNLANGSTTVLGVIGTEKSIRGLAAPAP